MRLADKAPILGLLRVGGIAVGPFENEEDGEQHLMKATRRPNAADGTTMRFVFEGLMRVSFTPLVGPQCSELQLPPRQRLALQGPRWGVAPPQAFPPSFINTAVALWHAAMHAHDSLPAKLPWDVWALHILPCLAHDDFEKQRPAHVHVPTHLPTDLPAYPPPPPPLPPSPPPGHAEVEAAAALASILSAGTESGYESESDPESEPESEAEEVLEGEEVLEIDLEVATAALEAALAPEAVAALQAAAATHVAGSSA